MHDIHAVPKIYYPAWHSRCNKDILSCMTFLLYIRHIILHAILHDKNIIPHVILLPKNIILHAIFTIKDILSCMPFFLSKHYAACYSCYQRHIILHAILPEKDISCMQFMVPVRQYRPCNYCNQSMLSCMLFLLPMWYYPACYCHSYYQSYIVLYLYLVIHNLLTCVCFFLPKPFWNVFCYYPKQW